MRQGEGCPLRLDLRTVYDAALAESRGEKVTPARLRRAASYLQSFANAMEKTQ